MPRPKPPPDISDLDPSELMLAVLTVFDQHHVGPEFRQGIHGEFGDLLERCGGTRQVLAAALAVCRRR
jgi:hypothetical protein